MRKQISTYGSILLTTMVIVRAATLEQDVDLSNLFSRDGAVSYVEENSLFRASILNPTNLQIAAVGMIGEIYAYQEELRETPSVNTLYDNSSNSDLSDDYLLPEIAAALEIENEAELELLDLPEDPRFSLDRESTISSNLSLLFPRERIKERPNLSELRE